MKKQIIYILLATFIVAGLFTSCKKDPDVGGTNVEALAGEWWVQIDDGSGPSGDYYSIITYNTAANNDSLWVDDADATFGIKGKVLANVAAQTFAGQSSPNQYADGGITVFTITDGKVVTGGAVAPGSKDKTDAISFTLTYDSPVQGGHNVYKLVGYKRTGFSQDDH